MCPELVAVVERVVLRPVATLLEFEFLECIVVIEKASVLLIVFERIEVAHQFHAFFFHFRLTFWILLGLGLHQSGRGLAFHIERVLFGQRHRDRLQYDLSFGVHSLPGGALRHAHALVGSMSWRVQLQE